MGHAGMDIDSFGRSMKTMQKNVLDGSEAFNALGVSTKDAEGNFRSQEEVMNDTILALAGMEDETARNALAQEVFGNQYTELLPLLNGGADAILAQKDAVHELGLVIDGEAITAGASLQDSIDDIKASFGTIFTQIAIQILPLVQQVADFILANMPQIQAVISTVASVVGTLVGIISQVVAKVFEVIPQVIAKIQEIWKNITEFVNKVKGIGSDMYAAGKGAIDKFLNGIKAAWTFVTS